MAKGDCGREKVGETSYVVIDLRSVDNIDSGRVYRKEILVRVLEMDIRFSSLPRA